MPEISGQLGNYRLIKELGRGSMGTVYLAHQDSLGRDRALKVLPAEFSRDEEFLARFKREAQTASRLNHPNIVRVIDFSFDQGVYYIVMDYIDGQSLRDLLQPGLPLGVTRTVGIVSQVLSALEQAHQEGVVHRDIKPANILVTAGDRAFLTDFSIAHIQDQTKLTRTGMMVGTPEYMAPEQFEGLGVDGRADLYAAGVILYEMLTGVQPFRGETTPEVMKAHLFKKPPSPDQLNREIPPGLAAVVMRALEKDPDMRYRNAEEMGEALRQSLGGDGTDAALETFLKAVCSGRVSMDEAIAAHAKIKDAIDQGFRKILTVMMVDLAGSSKLKTPNQTFHADQAFRHYRSMINACVEAHGCKRYDWSGDGAICIFEDAGPAVEAAVQIQTSMGEVGSQHQLSSALLARIGINTGDVLIDPRRTLGEFASRTVDQAGHLEKDCPPGQIHVSQATAEKAFQSARYEEVGVNRDGVRVFRVLLPETPPTRILCSRCGTSMPREARFCPACGAPVGDLLLRPAADSGGHGTPPPQLLPQAAQPAQPTGSGGHGGPAAPVNPWRGPDSGSGGHGGTPAAPPPVGVWRGDSGSGGHGPPAGPGRVPVPAPPPPMPAAPAPSGGHPWLPSSSGGQAPPAAALPPGLAPPGGQAPAQGFSGAQAPQPTPSGGPSPATSGEYATPGLPPGGQAPHPGPAGSGGHPVPPAAWSPASGGRPLPAVDAPPPGGWTSLAPGPAPGPAVPALARKPGRPWWGWLAWFTGSCILWLWGIFGHGVKKRQLGGLFLILGFLAALGVALRAALKNDWSTFFQAIGWALLCGLACILLGLASP